MTARLILLFAGIALFAQASSALNSGLTVTGLVQNYGAISGGGGKGVVCHAKDGSISSVQLLDLWEGQVLYSETPLAVSGNLPNDVDANLARLKNAYPFYGSGMVAGDPTIYVGQDYLLARIRSYAKNFFGPNPNVLRLHGVTLTLTDDSYELVKPSDCDIDQIVNFQPTGKILINEDLFELMDPVNQAALIAHESFYAFLRDPQGETTSIRTRRAIGYVASGGIFTVPPPMPPASTPNKVTCTTNELPFASNFLVFVEDLTSDPKAPVADFYPVFINGSALMGLTQSEFKVGKGAQYDQMLHGKCTGSFSVQSGLTFNGPVEYDRQIWLIMDCQNGTLSQYLMGGVIGEEDQTKRPLTCTYLP